MVGFDSTILPGRVGKVTQEVSMDKLHSGSIKKSVTVKSNATNKPELQLSIAANIIPIIEISPEKINLNNKGDKIEIALKTEKPNLTISRVEFKSNSRGGGTGPQWQADLPIIIDYTFIKKEGITKDNMHQYTITVSNKSALERTQHGQLIIETNHPEKATIELQGMISKSD